MDGDAEEAAPPDAERKAESDDDEADLDSGGCVNGRSAASGGSNRALNKSAAVKYSILASSPVESAVGCAAEETRVLTISAPCTKTATMSVCHVAGIGPVPLENHGEDDIALLGRHGGGSFDEAAS